MPRDIYVWRVLVLVDGDDADSGRGIRPDRVDTVIVDCVQGRLTTKAPGR